MRIRPRHMLVGGIVAVCLHLGVGLMLALQPAPPDSGAKSPDISGIEISLGPAGGAPGESQPVAEEATTVEAIEQVAVETELAELVEEAVATPTVEPKPVKKPEPVKVKEPVPTRVEAPDVAVETPVASESAESNEPPVRIATIPSGSRGESGTRDKQNAGSQSSVQAGGSPAAKADYISLLRAWLEQHKQYPRRARIRRQQGTAVLRFTMNREGQVISYKLEESSGYSMLDEEVEAMIKRAQPLPVMPDEMQQVQLELVVPVQFFLR